MKISKINIRAKTTQKLLAIFVLIVLLVSGLVIAIISSIPEPNLYYIAEPYTTPTYSNSDISALWIRRNGSDTGFDYGGANVSPSYGMNYFNTNVIQIAWGYNWTNIADTSLFPANSVIYIQIDGGAIYGPSNANEVADHALTDSRIKGAFIDDFLVSFQSPANMSAIYENLTHNDVALGYHLTLGLIVYNRNYFAQSPYSWADIEPYFDIIHFWYAVFRYDLLFSGLVGYEDDFKMLHSWLPTKEYWMGIYLHYYNIGTYPLNFTSEQMSIAGKLIKLGYATRYSLLENFWIQHNRPTAQLIRDFINDEYQNNYTTSWYPRFICSSYSLGQPRFEEYITDFEVLTFFYKNDEILFGFIEVGFWSITYLFTSTHLQNLTIHATNIDVPSSDWVLINIRTGTIQYPYWDEFSETTSFIIEPNERYRLLDYPLSDGVDIYGDVYINSPVTWQSVNYTIHGTLFINSSLEIRQSRLQFASPIPFNNSMTNFTYPDFGIIMKKINSASLFLVNTIIEPKLRAYPYAFYREYDPGNGTAQTISVRGSYISCFADRFIPAGKVTIENSTIFQAQPCTGDWTSTLWLMSPGYVTKLTLTDSILWNYDRIGVVGFMYMASNTLPTPSITNMQIIGGEYAVMIDLTWTDYRVIFNNLTSYASTNVPNLFITFQIGGGTEIVEIQTQNIFNWSIQSTGATTFIMDYTEIQNGIYTLTTDNGSYNIPVSTNRLEIQTSGPWWGYRNNYTLIYYFSSGDYEQTIANLIWLLFIFIVPMLLAQVIPKIGFIFGIILMLLITVSQESSFLPYFLVAIVSVVMMVYKTR